MPWTHSLPLATTWSWLYYRITKVRALGWCVFSHWILDLLAHGPDLPLYPSGPVIGLGLWRWRGATAVVETGLLLAGLIVYMRFTRPKSAVARFAVPVYIVLLIVVGLVNL